MDVSEPHAEGLHPPLSPAVRRRLRRAVVEHVRGREREPVLHVGEPGGREWRLLTDQAEPSDAGLRTDLVASTLDQAYVAGDEPLVWLTRHGELGLQDVDALWLAAARAAALEAGRPLTMVVVTRHGWRDPRSGMIRTWTRLRLTPGRGPAPAP